MSFMENRENVKKKIQKTFLNMVKTMPVEDIKVKELVSLAGVSRSSFYVYYDSVWDVLQEIEEEFWNSAYNIKRPALEQNQPDNNDAVAHEIIDYLKEHSDVMEAMTAREGDAAYLSTWMKGIRQQIALWSGEAPGSISARTTLLTEFTAGGIQRMLSYWSSHRDEISEQELLDVFDNVRYSLRDLFSENP